MNPVQLSQSLLRQVKMYQPTAEVRRQLEDMPLAHLQTALSHDGARKAFWINLYNAFFLILRRKGVEKPAIFRKRLIKVAGQPFSLDQIEHGILRKYRWKWAMGYLPNPFYRKTVRQLAVQQLDYRIHFALNCGARSCPPIAFYSSDSIEQELEMATRSFLSSETDVYLELGELHVSKLFLWYAGDFGGKRGVKNIVKTYLDVAPQGLKVTYKAYDHTESLDNFSPENF